MRGADIRRPEAELRHPYRLPGAAIVRKRMWVVPAALALHAVVSCGRLLSLKPAICRRDEAACHGLGAIG
jgi:hypothetical protein